MLRGLSKLLFGYDFFISYAYADGKSYAAELEKKLSNLDFACFFDTADLPAGEELPASLRRAIRRSKAFVLVGTEKSMTASWVQREVSTALEKRKIIPKTKIIPIDVDGIRERIEPPTLRELPWVIEERVAGQPEGPSAAVLERISGYFQFTRRNTIMRGLVGAAASVLLLIALIAVWQWRRAVEQRRIAIFERDRALSQQLAGQSRSVLEAEPDLALLLGVEAVSKGATFEARDALLAALQSRPGLVTLLHGAGQVRRLVFSPDGSALASSSSNGEVTVWDVGRGAPRARLQIGDSASASRLEFDREGRLLAAYRDDDRIAVWNVTPNKPPVALSDRDAAAFERLPSEASGAMDSLLAARVAKLKQRGDTVRSATLSVDGQILVTTDGQKIRAWAAPDSSPILGALGAHAPTVRTLAVGSNGLLASGSSAGTIALWDLKGWLIASRAIRHTNVSERTLIGRRLVGLDISANSLAFSQDGKTLAGGDYNGHIVLWTVDSGETREARSLEHGSNTFALRFSADGRALASYSSSQVTLWDVGSGSRTRIVPLTVDLQSAADFAPDLATVVLGGNSGELVLWDLISGKARKSFKDVHEDRLLALAFSPDGRTLASAGNAGRIILQSLPNGETTGTLEGHSNPVAALHFSADGTRLASYDSDGMLIVWDVASRQAVGRPLQRAKDYSATSSMGLSADGRTAVTSGPDGSLSLWDVETWRPLGRPLGAHPGHVTVIEFSPDGKWMASGGLGGAVFLWDLRPESWADRACAMANRSLTKREKAAYLIVADDGSDACDRVRRRERR